jgi:hypothetical protein
MGCPGSPPTPPSRAGLTRRRHEKPPNGGWTLRGRLRRLDVTARRTTERGVTVPATRSGSLPRAAAMRRAADRQCWPNTGQETRFRRAARSGAAARGGERQGPPPDGPTSVARGHGHGARRFGDVPMTATSAARSPCTRRCPARWHGSSTTATRSPRRASRRRSSASQNGRVPPIPSTSCAVARGTTASADREMCATCGRSPALLAHVRNLLARDSVMRMIRACYGEGKGALVQLRGHRVIGGP